jgi:hypothetical protein
MNSDHLDFEWIPIGCSQIMCRNTANIGKTFGRFSSPVFALSPKTKMSEELYLLAVIFQCRLLAVSLLPRKKTFGIVI